MILDILSLCAVRVDVPAVNGRLHLPDGGNTMNQKPFSVYVGGNSPSVPIIDSKDLHLTLSPRTLPGAGTLSPFHPFSCATLHHGSPCLVYTLLGLTIRLSISKQAMPPLGSFRSQTAKPPSSPRVVCSPMVVLISIQRRSELHGRVLLHGGLRGHGDAGGGTAC